MRAVVDRSNRPKRTGQWGHYDFTIETGLEFRFREPAGICLIGDRWTSDIHDFEAIWEQRALVSTEKLLHALDLSEHGIDIDRWPKEPVLHDCWEWVKERVNELYEHRAQIQEEVHQRSREEAEVVEGALYRRPAPAEELQKEEDTSSAAISGSKSVPIEANLIEEASTPVREVMRDPPSPAQPAEPTKAEPTWHSDIWLLNWIRENGCGDSDATKLSRLREVYRCVDRAETLKLLEYAYAYTSGMIELDPKRANNLFVETPTARMIRDVKRRFFGGDGRELELQAFMDAANNEWDKTIAREKARREGLNDETDEATSPEAKRFSRACLIRTSKQIEWRAKQLKSNNARSLKGLELTYPPAYDGELEKMFDFLIALVNLEGFRVVEIHKPEQRQGGVEPKSLNLRPHESEADRELRAARTPWTQNVLTDAIAVPDWSRPIARDLAKEQRKLLDLWAEREAKNEEDRQLRQIAIDSERPIPLRKRPQGCAMNIACIVSAWLTFVGLAGPVVRYIVNAMQGLTVPYTLSSVLSPAALASYGLFWVWLPLSWSFYDSYAEALIEKRLRPALGIHTILLICSIAILIFLAIVEILGITIHIG